MEERHGDLPQVWVMLVIVDPYDKYEEYIDGILHTVLVGRVPESRQWIKVVFVGSPDTGEFLTAYRDRRLDRRYGGGPWATE